VASNTSTAVAAIAALGRAEFGHGLPGPQLDEIGVGPQARDALSAGRLGSHRLFFALHLGLGAEAHRRPHLIQRHQPHRPPAQCPSTYATYFVAIRVLFHCFIMKILKICVQLF
jgi:hypothetical protein